MAFCVPVAFPSGITSRGEIIITYGQLCYGQDVPAPDLPDLDLPEIGPDLPAPELPGTGPDLANPDAPLTGAQVEADAQADVEQDACTEGCIDCAPRQLGRSVSAPAPQARNEQRRGYDYQHFVCNWHWYSPSTSLIEEWQFGGSDFDGLHPAMCRLFETKHGYDGFLDDDFSAGGRPVPKPWAMGAFTRMVNQGRAQRGAVLPHWPEATLVWVFSHMITKLYVFEIFLTNGWVPPIEAEVRPFI